MKNGLLAVALAIASLVVTAVAQPAMAEGKMHYLAIHVDDNDPMRMNIVLNNAKNVTKYYRDKGDDIKIEIVAHGPGLHMLREDTSPVKTRIAAMSLEQDNLAFSACGNTMNGMAKKEGKEVQLISEAKRVPAGVVRLMELQEQGWTYVRP
jgi:intracellular sulfur oxidation DsrE/DsrF family protein